MSVQTPVGVIPASKTVKRTIEVAVRRDTLENCTLACMRCANFRKGFLQLEFPPLSPDKRSGEQFRGDLSESDVCFPATSYFAIFFAAATDSTITISPIRLPFTVALSPASLSSSASCPSSV